MNDNGKFHLKFYCCLKQFLYLVEISFAADHRALKKKRLCHVFLQINIMKFDIGTDFFIQFYRVY